MVLVYYHLLVGVGRGVELPSNFCSKIDKITKSHNFWVGGDLQDRLLFVSLTCDKSTDVITIWSPYMGESNGGKRNVCPFWVQFSSFSCTFWGNLSKIIGWCSHLNGWRPSSKKSRIPHCPSAASGDHSNFLLLILHAMGIFLYLQ